MTKGNGYDKNPQKPKKKNTVTCMATQTDDKGANILNNTKMLTPRLT